MAIAKGSTRYVNTLTGEIRITLEKLEDPWKPVKKEKKPKPGKKGRKGFYNPETGESGLFSQDPGYPWIPGGCSRGRGMRPFYNPETGEETRSKEDPGPPWVPGYSPERVAKISKAKLGLKQTKETKEKRANSIRRRHREEGFSERELEGHRKVSEKLRGTQIPEEVRQKISKTLSGRNSGFNAKRGRSTAERLKCDTFYVVKITTPCGRTFGKWGSTSDKRSNGRWRAIRSKGYHLEVIHFLHLGEMAPIVEESIGKILHEYPANLPPEVKFGGYTETFEWSEATLNLLNYFCHELEKNPPSEGNWGKYWDIILQGFCSRHGGRSLKQ